MTRPCTTCAHYDVDPLAAAPVCDVTLTFAEVERRRTHRTACGQDGRWWEGATKIEVVGPTEEDRKTRRAPTVRVTYPIEWHFPKPAEPADGNFKREVGVMPFDTTNGLDGLGADMAPYPGPWNVTGLPEDPYDCGEPERGWAALAIEALGWLVICAIMVGCVVGGWMLAEWVGG